MTDLFILSPSLPEIFMLAAGVFILLVDLFFKRPYLTRLLSVAVLLATAALVAAQWHAGIESAWVGHYVLDPLAVIVKVALLISFSFIVIYAHDEIVREAPQHAGEYYLLSLFCVLGAMVLASAGSLLTLYLGLELMTLPVYALVALRREAAQGQEAAIKYFIMGALSSAVLLFGFSLLYGMSGTIILSDITVHLAALAGNPVVFIALVMIMIAVAFKLALVPAHSWVPDVYEGAPLSVSVIIASVIKLAAVGFALRLIFLFMPNFYQGVHTMLLIFAVLSIFIGNIVPLVQQNIRRILGYSTISHMGFIALALSLNTPQSQASVLFYIIVYALTSLGAFGSLLILKSGGVVIDTVQDLAGLNTRHRGLALIMLFVLLSLAGIPPFIGFFAKLFIFQNLMSAHLYGLVIYALILSVAGAYYYLRIIRVIYFEKGRVEEPLKVGKGPCSLLILNAGALLILSAVPSGLWMLCYHVFA